MHRTLILLPLVLAACEDGDFDLNPSNPNHDDTVYFTCHHGEVQYTYQGSIFPGSTTPSVDGCVQIPDPSNPPWTTDPTGWASALYGLCLDECSHQVDLHAAPLGRQVLGDTCYELDDEDIAWTMTSCNPMALQKQQELVLTYAPIVGDPVDVAGTVSYSVTEGRLGDTLEIHGASLAEPVRVVTGIRDATALLGFPEGTLLSVDQLSLAPVSVPLGREGEGVLAAGDVVVQAKVSVTEPGQAAVSRLMVAKLPFDLSVGISKELVFDSWSDGFGGTFSLR